MFILKDLIKLGGQTLLPLYSDSLYKLLSTIYPEHEWLPWKFSQNTYWDDSGNWKEFFDYAASKLHIKEMSDWYKITAEVYKMLCFPFILKANN